MVTAGSGSIEQVCNTIKLKLQNTIIIHHIQPPYSSVTYPSICWLLSVIYTSGSRQVSVLASSLKLDEIVRGVDPFDFVYIHQTGFI